MVCAFPLRVTPVPHDVCHLNTIQNSLELEASAHAPVEISVVCAVSLQSKPSKEALVFPLVAWSSLLMSFRKRLQMLRTSSTFLLCTGSLTQRAELESRNASEAGAR